MQAARGGLDRLAFVGHTQFRYDTGYATAIDYRVFRSYGDEGATIVVVTSSLTFTDNFVLVGSVISFLHCALVSPARMFMRSYYKSKTGSMKTRRSIMKRDTMRLRGIGVAIVKTLEECEL